MSNGIVPFNSEQLPAYLVDAAAKAADLNKDVALGAQFPTMSIRGKRFTVSRDGDKKILMKPGEDDEVAQNIGVVVMRANMHAKIFYLKKYTEGDSDGARPDCYSLDGVVPSDRSPNKQANKCAICPHNQWGSRVGDGDQPESADKKGKACADNARLAISAPDKIDPMLIRVPPASLKNLREAVKLINQRNIPYNAVIMKIGFDMEASSPKLTFKPIGLLGDATYAEVTEAYDSEVIRAIVGLDDVGVEAESAPAKPPVEADELDAALAARDATKKASEAAAKPVAEKAAPAAKPKATPAAKPAAKATDPVGEDDLDALMGKPAAKAPVEQEAPAPAAKASSGADSLLDDLDDLLGSKDD